MNVEKRSSLFSLFCLVINVMVGMGCSGGEDSLFDDNSDKSEDDKTKYVIKPVSDVMALETNKRNELQLMWVNPPEIAIVEISYQKEDDDEVHTVNKRVFGEHKSVYTLTFLEYGTYQIGLVAIDNYGKRSEKVTISATPAKEDTIDPDIIVEDKLPIADPYVLYYEGKYYAYGTRVNGFEVYISEDLKHWRRNETKALSPENSWGTRWYWAPEVYYVKSKNLFYMFYSIH